MSENIDAMSVEDNATAKELIDKFACEGYACSQDVVKALEDTKLIYLSKQKFDLLIETKPELLKLTNNILIEKLQYETDTLALIFGEFQCFRCHETKHQHLLCSGVLNDGWDDSVQFVKIHVI